MLHLKNKVFVILVAIVISINLACEELTSNDLITNKTSSPEVLFKNTDSHESEPTGDLGITEYTNGLKTAWRKFIANGQFRLASLSDMSFNDAINQNLAKNWGADRKPLPYVYAWGGLGYKKRPAESHLAAIIVDTTRTDSNRFGLVIFSPTQSKKDLYEIHWLYRNRDLSKTILSRASGSLIVEEYIENGSSHSCYVGWKNEQKQFECS